MSRKTLMGKEEVSNMSILEMANHHYKVAISPHLGGNLTLLYDRQQEHSILVPSDNEEMLRRRPYEIGQPLVYPANRIEDGKFHFDGRTYQLPINEPKNNNSLHGFFERVNYEVVTYRNQGERQLVELIYQATSDKPHYSHFPHEFELIRTYILTEEGLQTILTVRNCGKQAMPVMFAYHTAFNLEGLSGVRINLPIKERLELSQRQLPTGKQMMGDSAILAGEQGFLPTTEAMDNLYRINCNQEPVAILKSDKVTVRYEVDKAFHYFMVWNNDRDDRFICIEPQTFEVNGINRVSWEEDQIVLKPGEERGFSTKIMSEPTVFIDRS